MRCTEFLATYSDFRDGLIDDPGLERRVIDHLLACPRCMQYDARVARGVTLLRTLSDLEPSARSCRQLKSQVGMAPLRLEEPVRPAPAGVLGGLMVATAVILLVWSVGGGEPRAGFEAVAADVEMALPAARPLPAIVAIPSPPFVSFTELSAPSFEAQWRTPGAHDEAFVSWTSSEP